MPEGRHADDHDAAVGRLDGPADGHVEGRPVEIAQALGGGVHDLGAHGSAAGLGPQHRGVGSVPRDEGRAAAEPRDLHRQVPGQGGAHHVALADGERQGRQRRRQASVRQQGVFDLGRDLGFLGVREEVVQDVAEVSGHYRTTSTEFRPPTELVVTSGFSGSSRHSPSTT